MKDRTASRGGVEENRQGPASRWDAAPRRFLLTLLLDVVLVSGCETGIKPTATIAATDSADQLRINVVVVRKDGATLRTEVIRYSQAKNQVSSDQAFVFDEPTRHIKGQGFTADTAVGRPCKVIIDSVGRQARQVEVRRGETNVFAGGGVLAHCEGTGSTLAADSVAWFAGTGRFDMIGLANQVHIRDTAITLDARFASYYLRQERLEAHNRVVAVNRSTGSVLRGPNLTYYRAVKGVRDTLEMYATGRPTIEYRDRPDSGEPYVIVADRVRFKGNDRMWGAGQVTIDRSDFAARGDSMQLDQAAGFGVLVGKPRVEGKGTRSYKLTGTRIELGLRGREVRQVKALGNGVATGSDWRLTADTIHLHIDRKKLQQAFAWGPRDSTHGRAVSTLQTIRADSLALDLPDEVLTEA